MKAYSAFNNDGIAVTPRIVNYLQDAKGNHYKLEPKIGDMRAVKKKTARQIKKILIEVVKRGTGKAAQYPGLIVGGKTGTAHIAKNGRYVREYHSSFYGFANDKEGHKYTIGVLVIRAKKYRHYFASKSAVPTFKRVMDILVELEYLEPEGGIEAPSPEIKPNVPKTVVPKTIKPTTHTVTQEKVKPTKGTPKPKTQNTVKSLFNLESAPVKQKWVKPKPVNVKPTRPLPIKKKSTYERYEDLF